MAAIVYLEPDDEITSAAARMRGIEEIRIALVVPYGSRLATSRINFRLLAREAQGRGRRLSIVTGDAATRALAASAGLPVFGSVGEYEETEGAPRRRPTGPGDESASGAGPDVGDSTRAIAAAGIVAATTAAARQGVTHGRVRTRNLETRPAEPPGAAPPPSRSGRPGGLRAAAPGRGAVDPGLEETAVVPTVRAAGVPAARAAVGRQTTAPSTRRDADARPAAGGGRRSVWPFGRTAGIVAVAVVGLAVLAGAVGAYLLLPSADVTITARTERIGPVALEIRADPDATEPDAVARVVPARRLTFDVAVSDTFAATGRRVEESTATGSVTFSNLNTGGSTAIAAGSVVSTEGGIRFRTSEAVTLAAAQLILGDPIRVEPATAAVGVTAMAPGPAGNVPANAITLVPQGQDPNLVKVNNPAPTAGGARDEFPQVLRADLDAAMEELRGRIDEEFAAVVADPNRIPEGMTLFPQTAVLADPLPTTEPDTLVEQEIAEFELGLATTGTVIAVDARPVESIAVERMTQSVTDGYRLVDGSIEVVPGEPKVQGEAVIYPVSASAEQIRTLDGTAIREQIKGKSIDQARALLAPYGTVDLRVWPDWVRAIPTIDSRLSVRVEEQPDRAAPGPEPSPSAAGGGGPSGSAASSQPAASAQPATSPVASGSQEAGLESDSPP